MAITVKLASIITCSLIVAGGVGYSGYRYFSSTLDKSFSAFSLAFLKEQGDEKIWTAKLEALKTGTVVGSLQELKNAKSNNNLSLLKQACQKFYDPNFSSKGKEDFSDFKNYCAKNNKDVVGDGWISDFSTVENAEKVIKKIESRGSVSISLALIEIGNRHKESPKTENAKTDLNNWCKETGEFIYLGDEDLDLKTGKEYCKTPT